MLEKRHTLGDHGLGAVELAGERTAVIGIGDEQDLRFAQPRCVIDPLENRAQQAEIRLEDDDQARAADALGQPPNVVSRAEPQHDQHGMLDEVHPPRQSIGLVQGSVPAAQGGAADGNAGHPLGRIRKRHVLSWEGLKEPLDQVGIARSKAVQVRLEPVRCGAGRGGGGGHGSQRPGRNGVSAVDCRSPPTSKEPIFRAQRLPGPGTHDMQRTVLWIAALLAAAAATTGCGHRPAEAAGERADGAARPNVLIVVLDALRADRLGSAGYDREITPALDALAADPDAVRFDRHYVQGAYTKASTASLFTGLYVFQHGVIMGHEMHESTQRPGLYPVQVLAPHFETMAERFGGLGYRTFGVVKSYHLDSRYGFDQGFQVYEGPQQVAGDRFRVMRAVDLAAQGGPFFGYLHLNACHHPFPPGSRHPEIMQRYGVEAGFEYDEHARIAAGIDFTDARIMHAILDGEVQLQEDDERFLNLVYDAKARAADFHVTAIVHGLRLAGVYDDTLLIVTADHGEELYDHRGYGHGHALWDEVVRVPLVVKFPKGWKPAALSSVISTTTQAIDLLPSLLDLIDEEPGPSLPGSQLFDARARRGFAYAETTDEWTLVQHGFKLIDGSRRTLLFDLAADPGERTNRAESETQRLAEMRAAAAALREYAAVRPGEAPVIESELSEEAIRALRSLGYLR